MLLKSMLRHLQVPLEGWVKIAAVPQVDSTEQRSCLPTRAADRQEESRMAKHLIVLGIKQVRTQLNRARQPPSGRTLETRGSLQELEV